MMKKLFAIILAVVMLISLCACTVKPAETLGTPDTTAATGDTQPLKLFTVTVVHADQSEKTFTYETGETLLGDFLEKEGLIESQGADDGMFHTVDGEKADWNENQSYWAFYVGEEYAMTGIYDTEIEAAAAYKLVYTIG